MKTGRLNPACIWKLETFLKTDSGNSGEFQSSYGATGVLNSNYADYSAGFLTKPELGFAISASYLAAMLSSLAAGRTKAKNKSIIRAGIVLAAAGILFSLKVPLLAFFLIGAGGGAAVLGLVAAVSRVSSSGIAMGLFNTGIYAGLGLIPVFGSLFIGPLGYESVFLGSGLVLLTMLLLNLNKTFINKIRK